MFGGNQFLHPDYIVEIAHVREGERVADLGCGFGGYFVLPLAHKVGFTGKVYAVDIVPDALKTVENAARLSNFKNIQTLRANLERRETISIKDGELDSAFLINVLFQNTKRKEIIDTAWTLVRKGGILTIIDWVDAPDFGPQAQVRINFENTKKYLKQLGGEIVKDEGIGAYHRYIIAKK
jgi:ubiquinone/menaquinone biosynthesis C-methylase UbiE